MSDKCVCPRCSKFMKPVISKTWDGYRYDCVCECGFTTADNRTVTYTNHTVFDESNLTMTTGVGKNE